MMRRFPSILALMLTACGRGAAENNLMPSNAADPGHYDQPMAAPVANASVTLSAPPQRWRIGSPGFTIRVYYRNAPPGSGLIVGINRDLPARAIGQLPHSGGGITDMPVPISGDGSVEVRFEGIANTGMADRLDPLPVRSGRHILTAQMLNHQRQTIGLVVRNPDDRVLAEVRSAPFEIVD